ncbi:DUF4179 domain-containing protein [Paenibacillus donghaensis]|uniref:DUF4179 domain-containing protein n=1 Tax=Paenibacillus donghaensis TaxID=414771 RepID=UPI001883233D|nr:DUF4179 domain-containing protein [Paenibacillus donghaensis]MBE9914221.1 DUF4179 domain-containing protein [Paenibacillus donghaensis]
MKSFSDQEEQTWSDVLFAEGPDADFTSQVMQKLENVEMVRGTDEAQIFDHITAARSKRRTRGWIAGTTAAVIILAGVSAIWQTQFQDQAMSVFQPKPKTAEEKNPPGMEDWVWYNDYNISKPLGLIDTPGIKVEDKGYTFQIENVLFDRSRIVISTRQTAPDGSRLQSPLREGDDFHITDFQGNEVARRVNALGNSYPGIQEYTYLFTGPVPDTIVVRSDIDQIEIFTEKNPTREPMKVNWHFQFDLDMREAKKWSVEKNVNQQYTSPDGLSITAKNVIRTPNGIRLDYAASMDDKLSKLAADPSGKQIGIFYHLETMNAQGEKEEFDFGKTGAIEPLIKAAAMNEGTKGKNFTDLIQPLVMSPESKAIRFVLDGYSLPINKKDSVVIKPSQLITEPAVFIGEGDKVIFSGYELKASNFPGTKELTLKSDGIYANQVENETWVAVDEKGQEYPVSIQSMSYNPASAGNMTIIHDSEFYIRGMDHVPSKLTLTRTVVNKVFKDVDWSFELWGDTKLPWEARD